MNKKHMARKAKKQEFETIELKDIDAGQVIRVHQKIKDVNSKGEEKERIQVFEGLVLSRKHGNEPGATFIVRKVSEGIGVEKTFPVFSPLIDKIELVDTKMKSRSKMYFTRDFKKRLKSTKEAVKTYQKGETPKPGEKKKPKVEKAEAKPTEKKETKAKAEPKKKVEAKKETKAKTETKKK